MSQSQKRKRPESNPASGLAESDQQVVLNFIKSKGEDATTKRNIQEETKVPTQIVTKCINNLLALSLIKKIPHAHFKGDYYIAAEFKASNAVSGGEWYLDGKLDTQFINELKNACLHIVKSLKVATAEGVHEVFKKRRLTNVECTSQQISEILGSMVLENFIIEVKSSGHGEYHSIPVGNVCYRCPVGNLEQGPDRGAMASIPCGVCPRIRECTPDGLISPTTCVYYTKWLDF
ncbi:putative RNA polymerase Rpc34, winged helix-like DNA-binding domain superfamily [Helianthus debilis subsp. tardiflorus]